MSSILEQAKQAKEASYAMAQMASGKKDDILHAMADALEKNISSIMEANASDLANAKEKDMPGPMRDRLALNEARIKDMADGLRSVALLPDPTDETIKMWKRPNGLQIGKRRVPLGVVGIIYEARPNVTADAIGLCVKSGNACMLRGGSEAISSNMAIVDIMTEAAQKAGLPAGSIQLIRDTARETATKMMSLVGYLDVLIPRGGAGLIQSVIENAKVPVIETGIGNCHILVDESAELRMATEIAVNAKCSHPSVCNAAETLLVHEKVAEQYLPVIAHALLSKGVELRGDDRSRNVVPEMQKAKDSDWQEEYNDLIMAVKIVSSLDEAIDHINQYGTQHSEAIVTENYENAQAFLDKVDAAAVYVNASTRYTDGFEFGFGAEIGISTQKLHARGPMGLEELTSIKYVVYGSGQVRG